MCGSGNKPARLMTVWLYIVNMIYEGKRVTIKDIDDSILINTSKKI